MTVTTVRNQSEAPETATPRELNDNMRHAAELLFLGFSQVHVARTLGFREQSVAEWRKLPEFKQYLGELRSDARSAVVEAQSGQMQLAIEVMNELMLKGSPELRARVALAVWQRGLVDEGAPSANSNAAAVGAALLSALREGRHD
jgi:hypothetical protein